MSVFVYEAYLVGTLAAFYLESLPREILRRIPMPGLCSSDTTSSNSTSPAEASCNAFADRFVASRRDITNQISATLA